MLLNQYKSIFHSSFKAIKAQPLRSFLSTLGVMAGVTALIIMVSIGQGARDEAIAQVEKMGASNLIIKRNQVNQKFSTDGLNINDIIKASLTVPDVKNVVWAYKSRYPLHLSSRKSASVYGHSLIFQGKIPLLYQGRYMSEHDHIQRNRVAVISYALHKNYPEIGRVGNTINVQAELYTIIGILDSGAALEIISEPAKYSVYVPYVSLPQYSSSSPSHSLIDSAIITFPSIVGAVNAGNIIGEYLQKLSYSPAPELVIPFQLIQQIEKTQQRFTTMIVLIASLTLFVGGIGIANIAMATVSERRTEIGVRRACGASCKDIRSQFISESLVLSMIGATGGVIIGVLSVLVLIWLGDTPVNLPFWVIPLSISMAVIIGVAASVYPAQQASKVDPIYALKGL